MPLGRFLTVVMSCCYIETLLVKKEKPDKFWDLRIFTVVSAEPLYPLTLDRGRTVCILNVLPQNDCRIIVIPQLKRVDAQACFSNVHSTIFYYRQSPPI